MIGTTTLLEVSTLGRFEVHRHREPLNWSRRKVSDLFKILLSAEEHRLHREQIQELLWPSSTGEQAANSFGKTLYLLRRALEPDLVAGKGSSSVYVLLDHDTLTLLPENLKIDADLFESSAKQLRVKMHSYIAEEHDEHENTSLLDKFDAVLAFYRGDYLPEDLYEDWAQRRRDRLCRVHSWLLESAADLAIASGKALVLCQKPTSFFAISSWARLLPTSPMGDAQQPSYPAHQNQRLPLSRPPAHLHLANRPP